MKCFFVHIARVGETVTIIDIDEHRQHTKSNFESNAISCVRRSQDDWFCRALDNQHNACQSHALRKYRMLNKAAELRLWSTASDMTVRSSFAMPMHLSAALGGSSDSWDTRGVYCVMPAHA
jgi:hypothetical protein